MNKKYFISVLIASIGVSCSAWSQEDKHYSDTRTATTIVEDKVAIREADEVKVTSKPLQVKSDDASDSDVRNQKTLRPSGYPIEIKDKLRYILFAMILRFLLYRFLKC